MVIHATIFEAVGETDRAQAPLLADRVLKPMQAKCKIFARLRWVYTLREHSH